MKFIISFLLIMLLAYAGWLFSAETPWWMFAVGAFIGGWAVPVSPAKSWLAGFLAVFVLWGVLCYLANAANEGIMAGKMASILPLGGSANALILVSALVGGLIAGFAALTGSFLRKKTA